MTARSRSHPVDAPPAEEDRATRTRDLLAAAARAKGRRRRALQEEAARVNMGVARAVAARYRDRGEQGDDLVQVAYLGLMKAIRGFDPEYPNDFLSYAVPTISGEVKRYFRDCGWAVKPPRRIQELQTEIANVAPDLAQRLHRQPTPAELAEHLHADVDDVIEALTADGCFAPTSLDTARRDDDATTLGDLLGDDDPDLRRTEDHLSLAPLVQQLAPRDRRILYLRFFQGWTQERIAQDIGVTQMQVSRLLSRILAQLRQQLAA